MKKPNGKQLVCDVCGKPGARIRHVNETHGKGKDLLVIQNVPMVSCPNCGEAYFTAETLHELERLKRQRRALAVARPVEVLSYT
jgi:YgiT-type zinc finger domain-containing protein